MGNLAIRTEAAQPWLNERESALSHASWISGRVQTLLSHYFQPDNPAEVLEAAIDDWVQALMHVSQPDIDRACQSYLRDQPRRRPTPADILRRATSRPSAAQSSGPKPEGDRSKLSLDEQRILDEEVLPTARRWLTEKPALAQHAMKALTFWGEVVPLETIKDLQSKGHLPKGREA